MHPINSASESLASLAFGRFRVLPHRRELLADSRSIKLGGRAFDMLMALIDARGEVISKGALMARVWPDRVVEEKNLHVQISALRTALGAERELIHTVAGRGYQFTGEVRIPSASPDERAGAGMAVAQPAAMLPPTNLPQAVSELIGRDDDLGEILSLTAAHRLVTLTGPGGIGKTRLALAAARQLLPRFADGVWLAELSPLSDPSLVPATVAAAVGLELGGGEVSAQRVAQALADRRLVLVLDTCEHMIAAAAAMAEALLRAGSAVRILATSREPLRAEGERIYPVPPLAVPAAEGDDPWRYGAVWLFVVRSRASGAYVSEDHHIAASIAASIAAICRRLDGIPLAIELAAARVAALGIEEVAARLDDRFQLLTGGRRTALPRHQTLRATLDWSYELLAEPERVLLRRLAVFAGVFNLKAACAVVASPDISPPDVVEGLLGLVAKSLVSAEVSDAIAGYRLLDTTRAYAFEKLGESSETAVVARRHAAYYRDLSERAETELKTCPSSEWLSEYGRHIDNVRVALDWAFSPGGDASIGVALTAAAVPLWMHLSLLDECRGRAEQALTSLDAGMSRDARQEMKLHAALGASLNYATGEAAPETGAAWTTALEIAESLDDADYQLRSLWGLWVFHTVGGRYRAALELAQRFHTLAASRSDPDDRLVGEHLVGVSQHRLGNQPMARRHLERVLADQEAVGHRPYMVRFQIDLLVAARAVLARVLWLQGFPDQAMHAGKRSIEHARAADHAVSLCYALALGACPIALLVGDLATAEHYVGMLLDHSTRHALTHWRAFGTCHQGAVAIKRGDVMTGSRLLRGGFNEVGDSRPALRIMLLLMTEALGRAGQVSEGLAELNEAIARSEHNEERWLIAELLRIKGELLLLRDGAQGGVTEAEDLFRQALKMARRQGALSLELRAATSLARLLRD
ncbi:MAG TPA: winged helix-turn-helix domain-containing protein, partial [Stellaceae bacterium]|nr:winged helix-turn-helix domain-containing protein [Stellaceae bacterium]